MSLALVVEISVESQLNSIVNYQQDYNFSAVKPKQYKRSKRKGSLKMLNGRNNVKSCMLNFLGLLFVILVTSTYAFVELLHFSSSNSCKYF